MTVENLIHNAYLDNLGSDYVAIAANGHPIGRASTAEAIRQAVPDAAHYLSAADLHDYLTDPMAPAPGRGLHRGPTTERGLQTLEDYALAPEPNPVSAGLDAVVVQQAPVKDDDAKADKDLDDKAPAKTTAKKASTKK